MLFDYALRYSFVNLKMIFIAKVVRKGHIWDFKKVSRVLSLGLISLGNFSKYASQRYQLSIPCEIDFETLKDINNLFSRKEGFSFVVLAQF